MKQLRIPFKVLFAWVVVLLLVGCELPGPELISTPTSIPPTPLPAKCKPPIGFYQKTNNEMSVMPHRANSIAEAIYVNALTARNLNDEASLARERSKALQLLAYETLRWSRVQDIPKNGKKLRLILTFISPELIHAVMLNYVISNNLSLPNNNFRDYAQGILQRMDGRGEYAFLLSLQAELPENTGMEIEFRPKKIFLKNSEGIQTFASKVEDFFMIKFDMASSSQRVGFINFPQAVLYENECRLILDGMNEKKISVGFERVEIDGDKSDLFFEIPFSSLLGVEIIPTPNPNYTLQSGEHVPVYTVPSIQDIGLVGPVAALTNENLKYWQEVGRFVWANLATAYVP